MLVLLNNDVIALTCSNEYPFFKCVFKNQYFWTILDLSLIDKESDDVLERIMDEKTASELKILYGHSGPVYGASFSPDR